MYTSRDEICGTAATTGSSMLAGLLEGYRFSVCGTVEAAARAIDVRRAVYNDGCGYDVPVPDDYDSRSWLLRAEDVATGETVGTMRLTPRSAGPVELEEYFRLPGALRSSRTVELNRFAILPAYRKGKTFFPAVSAGLFALVGRFLPMVGARYMVVASKQERIWTYEWLRFKRTGKIAAYGALDAAAHELLWCDFRQLMAGMGDHPFADLLDNRRPCAETVLPASVPALGLAVPAEPEAPFRIAVGA